MKKELEEINLMRPILICICLVGYHAFAPFSGAWDNTMVCDSVQGYYWLDKFLYSFMLETFVFISGYVFAFQIQTLKRNYSIKQLVISKLKRLILPSVLFSLMYLIVFYDENTTSILVNIYNVFNGVGHMWFLPMLFWCFILGFLISKIRINELTKLLLLLGLSLCPVIPLPFQLHETCYYLFFFYLSFFVYSNKDNIQNKYVNIITVLVVCVLYILTFVLFTPIRDGLIDTNTSSALNSIINVLINKLTRIIYSSLGLVSFYLMCLYIIKNGIKASAFLLSMNGLCMGIYLFQQFVLKYLYYYTELPFILGSYIFPWIGYLTSLIISSLLTFLIRRTKMGRAII